MATIEDLKGWFARDLKFAQWDQNVQADNSDPSETVFRFYTATNEYALKISPRAEGLPRLSCVARARKPRAGLPAAQPRQLLRNPQFPNRLNERTWRRLLAAIVGYELVRVHRAGKTAKPGEPEPVEEPARELEEAEAASSAQASSSTEEASAA